MMVNGKPVRVILTGDKVEAARLVPLARQALDRLPPDSGKVVKGPGGARMLMQNIAGQSYSLQIDAGGRIRLNECLPEQQDNTIAGFYCSRITHPKKTKELHRTDFPSRVYAAQTNSNMTEIAREDGQFDLLSYIYRTVMSVPEEDPPLEPSLVLLRRTTPNRFKADPEGEVMWSSMEYDLAKVMLYSDAARLLYFLGPIDDYLGQLGPNDPDQFGPLACLTLRLPSGENVDIGSLVLWPDGRRKGCITSAVTVERGEGASFFIFTRYRYARPGPDRIEYAVVKRSLSDPSADLWANTFAPCDVWEGNRFDTGDYLSWVYDHVGYLFVIYARHYLTGPESMAPVYDLYVFDSTTGELLTTDYDCGFGQVIFDSATAAYGRVIESAVHVPGQEEFDLEERLAIRAYTFDDAAGTPAFTFKRTVKPYTVRWVLDGGYTGQIDLVKVTDVDSGLIKTYSASPTLH